MVTNVLAKYDKGYQTLFFMCIEYRKKSVSNLLPIVKASYKWLNYNIY